MFIPFAQQILMKRITIMTITTTTIVKHIPQFKKTSETIVKMWLSRKLWQLGKLSHIKAKPFIIFMTMMVLSTLNKQCIKGQISSRETSSPVSFIPLQRNCTWVIQFLIKSVLISIKIFLFGSSTVYPQFTEHLSFWELPNILRKLFKSQVLMVSYFHLAVKSISEPILYPETTAE